MSGRVNRQRGTSPFQSPSMSRASMAKPFRGNFRGILAAFPNRNSIKNWLGHFMLEK